MNTNPGLQTESISPGTVPVKAYTKKQLCMLYKVTYKILIKWLADLPTEISVPQGRHFTHSQVRAIFAKFGVPDAPDLKPGNLQENSTEE